MIVLHASPLDPSQVSGLNASVPGLVAAQNALEGVDAGLLVTIPRPLPSMPFPVFECGRVCPRTGRPRLSAPFDRPDLVVFHSTYVPLHTRIAHFLRRQSIPYVICPRGGMTRYAQACKRWKKAAGNLLFFNRFVRGAAALHCLTEGESAATVGWRVPHFVVGNGVALPGPPPPPLRVAGGPRIAFMGRLHIDHKGLDLLVDACRLVRDDLVASGAVVEIWGPDCQGSVERLGRRIAATGTGPVVSLHGPVAGRDKSALLHSIDVFVHPSRTEGHPTAVLEALAHGAPCLLTPNTNMADEVAQARAGWRVEASVEGVAQGLASILDLSRDELNGAGQNAAHLARSRYLWPAIAEASVGAYRRFAA